jgi:hypothetical protein
MLWVVAPPGLHTLPVALLLVSTTLPPAQKVVGPPALIVGVGLALTVTGTWAVAFVPHPFDAVTVYVPVAATVALLMEGFWAVELKPFGPAQEYVTVPPVAVAFKFSVEPAQMGLLLPVAPMVGPATGVPAHPQFGAVPVYTSLIVHALLSLQGVPGSAVPPITPRQSAVQAPKFTGVGSMAPVFSIPPRERKKFVLFGWPEPLLTIWNWVQPVLPVTGIVTTVCHVFAGHSQPKSSNNVDPSVLNVLYLNPPAVTCAVGLAMNASGQMFVRVPNEAGEVAGHWIVNVVLAIPPQSEPFTFMRTSNREVVVLSARSISTVETNEGSVF